MNRRKIAWLVTLAATACVLFLSHVSVVRTVTPTRSLLNGRKVADAVGSEIQERAPSSQHVNEFGNLVFVGTNPAGQRR